VTFEYVEGQTLAQWKADHPSCSLEQVRTVIEQLAQGLQAFHRMEMVHQDVRPENVMLDRDGVVRIIDLGATKVASVSESQSLDPTPEMLGTLQFSAPEYLVGEGSSARSDVFSLGVLVYHLLSGQLPYGVEAARVRRRADWRRLEYRSLRELNPDIPAWVDGAIRKAVEPDPLHRHAEVSEFIWDLRHPNPTLSGRHTPWIERDPVLFWKSVSALLLLMLLSSWWWLSVHR
jgi:serine/threonine protein kinase